MHDNGLDNEVLTYYVEEGLGQGRTPQCGMTIPCYFYRMLCSLCLVFGWMILVLILRTAGQKASGLLEVNFSS